MRIMSPVGTSTFFILTVTTAFAGESMTMTAATRNQCMKTLRDGLTSDQFWPSMHAAEALTLVGCGDEVCTVLKPKLPTVKDAQHRCGVARELFRAGDANAINVLWEVLASEAPHGHGHACESLFKIRQIGDGKLLKQHMNDAKAPTKQLMAAAALARHGDMQAQQMIHNCLISDDDNMARLAAWTMAVSGDNRDIVLVRERAKSISDPRHKVYFHAALAMFGDEPSCAALQADLDHEDPMVRVYAAEFCGHAKIAAAIPTLAKLLDDDDLDVRIRAAQALCMLDESA